MIIKNTKIVCTLGPATDTQTAITKLVKAGMNAVRLNFSHGTHAHHKQIIKNVRAVSKKLSHPITLIQDLQGPKIRVGEMPDIGVMLLDKEKIVLTTEEIIGDHKKIPIQYKKLPKEVKVGDTIMLCDGEIELQATRVQKTAGKIYCDVIVGGVVKSHKGINVPTASLKAPSLTPKDKKDLEFGLKMNVDYVALSFVKNAQDVKKLRQIIEAHGKSTKIISKIERHEAVENLQEIIEASDGVMVARGDLGVEIRPEKVPMIQKRMIKLANIQGIPVITATEVLQSMVSSPRATRAEVSDAANAVLDHTDALMLSNESAVGKHPIKAVSTLTKTAHEVESYLSTHESIQKNKIRNHDLPIVNSLCLRACQLARDIEANYIVVITDKGFTARQIAKHRPYVPIITITASAEVQRELSLVWGLNHIIVKKVNFKNINKEVVKILKKHRLVKANDEIVICNSSDKESYINTIII